MSENNKTPQEVARELLSKVSQIIQEKSQALEKKEKIEDPMMTDMPLSKCGEMKKNTKQQKTVQDRRQKAGTPHDRTKEGNPDFGAGYVPEDKEPIRNTDESKKHLFIVKKGEEEKKNPSFDREKKDKEWTNAQAKMVNATKPGKISSNRADQARHIEEAKERRNKMRQEGLIKEEKHINAKHINEVRETEGIDFDKASKKEMKKCGEMKKSEHTATTKLVNFLNKRK